jgi:hypothetical protein
MVPDFYKYKPVFDKQLDSIQTEIGNVIREMNKTKSETKKAQYEAQWNKLREDRKELFKIRMEFEEAMVGFVNNLKSTMAQEAIKAGFKSIDDVVAHHIGGLKFSNGISPEKRKKIINAVETFVRTFGRINIKEFFDDGSGRANARIGEGRISIGGIGEHEYVSIIMHELGHFKESDYLKSVDINKKWLQAASNGVVIRMEGYAASEVAYDADVYFQYAAKKYSQNATEMFATLVQLFSGDTTFAATFRSLSAKQADALIKQLELIIGQTRF